MAASGCISAVDRRFMFRFCGAGDPAANQKNRGTVHCGDHKAPAIANILLSIRGSMWMRTEIFEMSELCNNLGHF